MKVRCGNTKVHGQAHIIGEAHHESVAAVRMCFSAPGGIYSLEEAERAVAAQAEAPAGWGEVDPTEEEEAPAAPAPAARTTVTTEAGMAEPGYYVATDGDFVCVVRNRAKTATYAKRLVIEDNGARKSARWDYAPGVGRTLATLEPMTLEAAKAFGHLHGFCIKCCRPLTDPKSVEAGIGPVCAKAFRTA